MKSGFELNEIASPRNWFRNIVTKFFPILVAGLITTPSLAELSNSTMGVGVAFAPIGGHGFSYRKLPESGFGYQCGTIFWRNNGDSYFNVGGEVLYVLKHTRLTAFYIPAGIGFSYTNQMQWRYDPNLPNQNQEYREKTTHISGGAGLGFAARAANWEDIWFSLDLVMVADKADILPLPQFAIHYFFR